MGSRDRAGGAGAPGPERQAPALDGDMTDEGRVVALRVRRGHRLRAAELGESIVAQAPHAGFGVRQTGEAAAEGYFADPVRTIEGLGPASAVWVEPLPVRRQLATHALAALRALPAAEGERWSRKLAHAIRARLQVLVFEPRDAEGAQRRALVAVRSLPALPLPAPPGGCSGAAKAITHDQAVHGRGCMPAPDRSCGGEVIARGCAADAAATGAPLGAVAALARGALAEPA